jgi:hypothetical protein
MHLLSKDAAIPRRSIPRRREKKNSKRHNVHSPHSYFPPFSPSITPQTHNRLQPSLLTSSLNTYPAATGLTRPSSPTPFGDFFRRSVKNTGCLTDASSSTPTFRSCRIWSGRRGREGGIASICVRGGLLGEGRDDGVAEEKVRLGCWFKGEAKGDAAGCS